MSNNSKGNSDPFKDATIDPSSYYGSVTCASTSLPVSAWATFPIETIRCPLPDDALERLLALGVASNKELLKKKLLEAYKGWCSTQTVPVSIIPVLLIVSLMSMGVEFDKELDKEREKILEKEE
jgi:hypothetical protein